MVFHRLIRECDASLLDELLKLGTAASNNGGATSPTAATSRPSAKNAPRLSLDGWVDTTTLGQARFDFSSYVRALARYLDEQLDVYERINYLIESDRGEGPPPSSSAAASFGGGGRGSRFRSLDPSDLLFQLPRVQALLLRLADCAPAGAAAADTVVAASLAPVVKESFRGFRAASEGVINLADSLFEMSARDATRALDAYRASLLLTAKLQAFFRAAEGVAGLRGCVQFPRLEAPPADFVGQIEEYVASVSGASSGGDGGVPAAAAAAAAAPSPSSSSAASAAAPAPAAAAFVPLRRGRFMSSTAAAAPLPPLSSVAAAAAAPAAPPSSAVVTAPPSPSVAASPRQNTHDPGMVLPSPAPASIAPAPAAAPAVDLLGDLLSPNPAETAPEPAAAAASAPFDPFAPAEAAPPWAPLMMAEPRLPGSSSANGSGRAAAAGPPSFAPGATGLLGANPFGAAAPAEFTSAPVIVAPVVAAPVALPPAAAAAAEAAAAAPPAPSSSSSAASDPFAGLGGLTLGPGPKMTPPLKAMAPERGRPMSSEKGAGVTSTVGGDVFDGF